MYSSTVATNKTVQLTLVQVFEKLKNRTRINIRRRNTQLQTEFIYIVLHPDNNACYSIWEHSLSFPFWALTLVHYFLDDHLVEVQRIEGDLSLRTTSVNSEAWKGEGDLEAEVEREAALEGRFMWDFWQVIFLLDWQHSADGNLSHLILALKHTLDRIWWCFSSSRSSHFCD